ncbi:MAG: DUF3006 domain-containing protein [Candidatus Berkelbacteria bacterium]
MKNNKSIQISEAVLDRFEGDRAVLTVDEEEIILFKKIMPAAAKEGDTLVVSISTREAETKRKTQKAKELLNEILGGSSGR